VRTAFFIVVLGALAVPGSAFAHGRGPTVAIDYRLALGRAPAGVTMKILDGDRSLEAHVDRGTTLVVRGILREPMLRIGPAGVFVNEASPTAQSDRIASGGSGWHRVNGGATYAWHDHRLAPSGPGGRIAIPVVVDGRPFVVAGTFARVPRPSLLVWSGSGAVLAAAVAVVTYARRSLRVPLGLSLGIAGGLAALVATIAFAMRDRPSGGIDWLEVGGGIGVALVLGVTLLRLRDRRRARAAGVAGAVAGAVTIAALPVFWHGDVISALPGGVVRALCVLALVGGASAAGLSLLPEFDG
jgi:hypothetical protein